MLIIAGLLMLLLIFAPAALALSAFALACAGVFRRLLRRPALSRGVRCLIYALVIAGVRLACVWLTRHPSDDCIAGDILVGAVILPEAILSGSLDSPSAHLALSGLVTLGDSVLWAMLLTRYVERVGNAQNGRSTHTM